MHCWILHTILKVYKAVPLLCLGLIVHILKNTEDIEKMGSPQTTPSFLPPHLSLAWLLPTINITATSFLSGFYLKELIIEIKPFIPQHSSATILILMSSTKNLQPTHYLFSPEFNHVPTISPVNEVNYPPPLYNSPYAVSQQDWSCYIMPMRTSQVITLINTKIHYYCPHSPWPTLAFKFS